MTPPSSKKAENLKAEAKKLEDIAKRKVQTIIKTEKAEEENAKKEIQEIRKELEKFKKKTDDVMSGNAADTGWDEIAVKVGERMKLLVEQEARQQHNLLLKTDEATAELELKAKPIRKELPLVSDFSEEDRVQLLTGIDKSIHKLKEKREMLEMVEAKLNRQMQVLMENTPDPTEDKQTILSKLQMSYDVLSGANDPDRARDDLLKQLCPDLRNHSGTTIASTCSKKNQPLSINKKPAAPHQSTRTARASNPSVSPEGVSRPPRPELPPSTNANPHAKPPPDPTNLHHEPPKPQPPNQTPTDQNNPKSKP